MSWIWLLIIARTSMSGFGKHLLNSEGEYADYFYFREGKDGQMPANYRSYFAQPAWDKVPGTDKYYLHMFAKEQPDLNFPSYPAYEALYAGKFYGLSDSFCYQ